MPRHETGHQAGQPTVDKHTTILSTQFCMVSPFHILSGSTISSIGTEATTRYL